MDTVQIIQIILVIIGLVGVGIAFYSFIIQFRVDKRTQGRINKAETEVKNEPAKAKPAWDLASVILESYFNKNLNQITAIFILSVVVMSIGFFIIIWGITQAISNTDGVPVAIITTCAGIVTEFISATFLYIYKSTIQQAAAHTKTLERINSVGMAMQILDTIPDDATKTLKNETKAMLVRKLMDQASGIQSTPDEETKPNE